MAEPLASAAARRDRAKGGRSSKSLILIPVFIRNPILDHDFRHRQLRLYKRFSRITKHFKPRMLSGMPHHKNAQQKCSENARANPIFGPSAEIQISQMRTGDYESAKARRYITCFDGLRSSQCVSRFIIRTRNLSSPVTSRIYLDVHLNSRNAGITRKKGGCHGTAGRHPRTRKWACSGGSSERSSRPAGLSPR